METNNQATQQQSTNNKTERAGFHTNVMPVLSKDGEYVYFFLPDMTVVENANRFKGLLGIEYTPKAKEDRIKSAPRTGLHAKVQISLSQSKEWVTIYLPGNLGKISNHVNAYKRIFKVEYTKKERAVA